MYQEVLAVGENREVSKNEKKLEGSISLSQISSNHISIIRQQRHCSWASQNDYRRMAVQVTDIIFREIDTKLAEYSTQDV